MIGLQNTYIVFRDVRVCLIHVKDENAILIQSTSQNVRHKRLIHVCSKAIFKKERRRRWNCVRFKKHMHFFWDKKENIASGELQWCQVCQSLLCIVFARKIKFYVKVQMALIQCVNVERSAESQGQNQS